MAPQTEDLQLHALVKLLVNAPLAAAVAAQWQQLTSSAW